MRPIFTIHAGEYLVADYIERTYEQLNVWVPSKDAGIDLLVTNETNTSAISLQVKSSKSYTPTFAPSDYEKELVVGGLVNLNHKSLEDSTADLWVIILISHERETPPQHIVIPPKELLEHLIAVHGKSERYMFYPQIKKAGKSKLALEGRGLKKADKQAIVQGHFELDARDLTPFLEDWKALDKLAGK